MGLLDTIRAGVDVVFSQTAELQELITIFKSMSPTYDTTSGAVATSEVQAAANAIPLSIRRGSENDVFHSFENGDEALLIRTRDIPFELSADMRVLRGDSEWILVQVVEDPSKTTSTLQLRQKQ